MLRKELLNVPLDKKLGPVLVKKYANYYGYSDVNPFEVVNVVSDKTIDVRSMLWKKAADTVRYEQKWDITPNSEAAVVRIRRRKSGSWYDAGGGGHYELADEPRKYHDYSF